MKGIVEKKTNLMIGKPQVVAITEIDSIEREAVLFTTVSNGSPAEKHCKVNGHTGEPK